MEKSSQTTILRIKLREAMLIAEKAHHGQTDKAGQPYFLHPKAVSEIVCNLIFSWYGEDECYEDFFLKAEIVSLLHDVIEDTDLTIEDLRKNQVPFDCIEAIKALTKTAGQDYDDYLTNLKSDRLATIVKIADLTHNSDLSRLAKVTPEDMTRREKYQRAIKFLGSFQCARCGRVKHVSELGDKPTHTDQPLCASCVDKYVMEYDEYEDWIERRTQ
jgi:(p)ppGpp synthase/HD superfamily hydrolase